MDAAGRPRQSSALSILWAAAEDCVPCVEYWLEQGADVHRGQESASEKTALWWAKECSAKRVLPLLDQAATGNRADKLHKIRRTEGAFGGQRLDEEQPNPKDTLTGIWLDVDETTAALTPFVEDASQRKLWRAAMQGNASRVFELLYLESTVWPVKPVAVALPLRMESWTLMEFVELACQFWTGKMADFVEKLNMVQSVLRDFEKNRVERVVEFYTSYAVSCSCWLSWQQGVIEKDEDDDEENHMIAFWQAFAAKEIRSAYATFGARENWCVYDPFLEASEANIRHPAHCGTWPLRCFVAVARPEHFSRVRGLETQWISDTLTGWWSFTLAEQRAISVLLCEPWTQCDTWVSVRRWLLPE